MGKMPAWRGTSAALLSVSCVASKSQCTGANPPRLLAGLNKTWRARDNGLFPLSSFRLPTTNGR